MTLQFKTPKNKRHRLCCLCGQVLIEWSLIGGGYGTNWFAALLREALPVAMCERCFRQGFYYTSSNVEMVGIAVLPDVEVRSVRMNEIEKFLVNCRRSYGRGDFSCKKFLSNSEIFDLVERGIIHRSIHISRVRGKVSVLYNFEQKADDGLSLQVDPQSRTVFVECYQTGWKCTRQFEDFVWLRANLIPLCNDAIAQNLPSLPFDFIIGKDVVSGLGKFLRYTCVHEPFCSSSALSAFLRPGMAIGRASVDLRSCGSFLVPRETKQFRKFKPETQQVNRILKSIRNCLNDINQLQSDFFRSEANGSLVDSLAPYCPDMTIQEMDGKNAIRIVEILCTNAASQRERWRECLSIMEQELV